MPGECADARFGAGRSSSHDKSAASSGDIPGLQITVPDELRERITAHEQSRRRARDIATLIAGGDPTGTPMVHPLRCSGTWNLKSDPPVMARIDDPFQAEVEADRLDVQRLVTLAVGGELAEGAERNVSPRIEVSEQRMEEARQFGAVDRQRHGAPSPASALWASFHVTVASHAPGAAAGFSVHRPPPPVAIRDRHPVRRRGSHALAAASEKTRQLLFPDAGSGRLYLGWQAIIADRGIERAEHGHLIGHHPQLIPTCRSVSEDRTNAGVSIRACGASHLRQICLVLAEIRNL